MTLGSLTDRDFAARLGEPIHPAGCTYGGFSCGYWLTSPECGLDHWERHIVGPDGTCPCGHEFPGAANEVVFTNE